MNPQLIFITDPSYEPTRVIKVIEQAAAALPAGAFMVQVRDKRKQSAAAFGDAVKRLHEAAKRAGALFTINAICPNEGPAFDLAEELGVDGLHVRLQTHQIATAKTLVKWVSAPTHTTKEVQSVAMLTPTAVLISPIFATPGKGPPRGIGALYEAGGWCSRSSVYALGGIGPEYASMCAQAGAKGVAVIRALLDADDVADTARRLAAPFIAV